MFKRIHSKQLLSWLGQLLLIAAVWTGVSCWQQKDLLQGAEPAPGFMLQSLEGKTVSLAAIDADRTLLYFFAPWCSICKLSIGNLDDLQSGKQDVSVAIVAVALSYGSIREVEAFVEEQELSIPVLLGSDQTLHDYRIELFPTYYVLDREKKVLSKSVGYSTELGMWLRIE